MVKMRERNFGKVSVIMDAFSTRSKEGKLDPRAAEDAVTYIHIVGHGLDTGQSE